MAKSAEERVFARLREALPATYRLYPNVRWLGKPDKESPARDGETDLLIVHPEHGLLIVETKGGRIRRDGQGRWWSGEHRLDPPPFTQAETSKRNLTQKLTSLPDWPGTPTDLRAGHAVAFPDVSARTTATRAVGLGPDTDLELVIDQVDLESPESARKAVDRAYDFWLGDRRRGSELSRRQLELIDELLAPTVELAPMLRPEVEAGEREVVRLTAGQLQLLGMLRGQRRAAVVGPAGTGKTMLAREKARRLASEGFSTLLVCYNQPLARMLHDELADAPAPGGLHVTTFHELCLTLGREAGMLPQPEPAEKTQEWWDVTLPAALEAAIPVVGGRYHAIVVDEGQDFARDWLESLFLMLTDPDHDVLYVFHDPAQALFREDVVATLGLPEYTVDWNCRNTGPIHELAARYAGGLAGVEVLRKEGRAPEIIPAAGGPETVEALRVVLHRLRNEEGLAPWQIAVLTGRSLAKSDVWRQRKFGNEVLWNGSYDDAGHSLGVSADEAPDEPTDTILFDSIRRFIGLEREGYRPHRARPVRLAAASAHVRGATRARDYVIMIGNDALQPHATDHSVRSES